ncbi:MAG: tetratricopeptide repeat protein, partial [Candidatus Brocadiaceae bacterium]|nr:tetratricopeptide repeat protein [Candidatus Brocadiaceae bacterium]
RDAEALKCYDLALERTPRFAEALRDKAEVLRELGKFNEALECCQSSLEIEPGCEATLRTQALIQEALGKTVDSKQ